MAAPLRKKLTALQWGRLIAKAECMYVYYGLQQKFIAADLKVSQQTISKWKKEGGWKAKKLAAEIDPKKARGEYSYHIRLESYLRRNNDPIYYDYKRVTAEFDKMERSKKSI